MTKCASVLQKQMLGDPALLADFTDFIKQVKIKFNNIIKALLREGERWEREREREREREKKKKKRKKREKIFPQKIPSSYVVTSLKFCEVIPRID